VHGDHCQDVLQLGESIRVEHQVFAQVTSLNNFVTCEAEEGVFGLAFTMISSHNYPSLLSNLDSSLLHSIFSLYLNANDDYPDQVNDGSYANYDEYGNMEYGGTKPKTAKSQIVFGGVDQKHYEGCLQWHALGQFKDENTGGIFEGYWDFALDVVKVGGTTMPTTSVLALVDSGSSYIVGPPDDVSQFATINTASCFQMEDPDNPTEVDCASGEAFDAAIIDCDQPFFNLEFLADGATYVLEKEDLVMRVETSFGEACILRIVGSEGIPVRTIVFCAVFWEGRKPNEWCGTWVLWYTHALTHSFVVVSSLSIRWW
jgi:hypothetical protein